MKEQSTTSTLAEAATRTFRGRSKNGASLAREGSDAGDMLANQHVEDLVIDCGYGDEESIPYHLYTGTTLRNQATKLIVRFATRTVVVEGERLRPYREAISSRRLARLRLSSRPELISAQNDDAPVISGVKVFTPKEGEIYLQAELETAAPGSV